MNEMPQKLEITIEDFYRIIGELEVLRRKHQEIISKLIQRDEPQDDSAPIPFAGRAGN